MKIEVFCGKGDFATTYFCLWPTFSLENKPYGFQLAGMMQTASVVADCLQKVVLRLAQHLWWSVAVSTPRWDMSGSLEFQCLFNYFWLFFLNSDSPDLYVCPWVSHSCCPGYVKIAVKGCFATLEKILSATGACLAEGTHRAEQTQGEPEELKCKGNRKDPQLALAFVLHVLGRLLWWAFIP